MSASTTYYYRAYLRFPALPGATAKIFTASSGTVASARLTTGGKLQLWNDSGTPAQIGSDSAATIAINTYYRVESKIVMNASTQLSDIELRLDGATVASTSGLALPLSKGIFAWGWPAAPGANLVIYLDDVATNDSTGAANNSWCDVGNVVALLPTADSAVGTGWTLGTGTAISANSGSTAVKNVPPLGVADLAAGSDPKQIRNASSNANVNYDATMTTYTAAGIEAGATINAVQPWVATAAPLVTSAKLGTVGVVSNPAITSVNLAAQGTSGAFWQGNAGGTYNTGWKWSRGTMTNAPSVTLGTAPVMRITQVTASTRIAVVCFMGMYVDYTPSSGSTYTKAGYGRESL